LPKGRRKELLLKENQAEEEKQHSEEASLKYHKRAMSNETINLSPSG